MGIFLTSVFLMMLGGAGMWRWENRNKMLFLLAAAFFCAGTYFLSKEFILIAEGQL